MNSAFKTDTIFKSIYPLVFKSALYELKIEEELETKKSEN